MTRIEEINAELESVNAGVRKRYATVTRFGFGHRNELIVEHLHSTPEAAITAAKRSRNSNLQYVLMAVDMGDGSEAQRGDTVFEDHMLKHSDRILF